MHILWNGRGGRSWELGVVREEGAAGFPTAAGMAGPMRVAEAAWAVREAGMEQGAVLLPVYMLRLGVYASNTARRSAVSRAAALMPGAGD